MSDDDVTASAAGSAMERALAELLLIGAHKGLPALTSMWADLGHRTVRITTADYESVRTWGLALGGPAEPDRLVVGAEGLVFYTVTGTLPDTGWRVDAEAKVSGSGSGLALNDDILDALELIAGQPS